MFATLTTLVALLGAPTTGDAPDLIVVTLPLEAHVGGTEIELGELATLGGAPELVARLAALELGYAPAPGYSRLLRTDQIARALATRAPEVRVRFEGQKATRVWPAVERVSSEALQAAAEDALRLRWSGAEVSLAPASPIASVEVPASPGGASLRARVESSNAGGASVALDVLVDGGLYRTVWTRWKTAEWRTLPVLARDVAAGETLTTEHFTWRRVAVGTDMELALAPDTLVGAVSIRALTEGQPVRGVDIRRALAIHAGATLTLSVRKGAIEARVGAVALEGAGIGDRLRVRTEGGEQELSARLVQPDLAVIELDRR